MTNSTSQSIKFSRVRNDFTYISLETEVTMNETHQFWSYLRPGSQHVELVFTKKSPASRVAITRIQIVGTVINDPAPIACRICPAVSL